MSRYAWVLLLAGLLAQGAHAQGSQPDASPPAAAPQAQQQAGDIRHQIQALSWVKGPTTVSVAGNSSLRVPAGYAFLDSAGTTQFEALTHNLAGGSEVLLAPTTLAWVAYLDFSADGLVKDDQKIDAAAILSSLKSAAAQENEERRRRGWSTLEITGWALPPAYNNTTKRLEWATSYETQGEQGINFFTKILGRRGVTSVVLVSAPASMNASISQLDQVLTGYRFNSGERYADFRPGDKVAEYGLAGLIVGGAVAAAAKTGLLKGLWKLILPALAAAWKFIAAGVVALLAAIKSLFTRKKAGPA